MATNVNSATVAPLQSSSRTGEVKSDKLVVSRDGSAGGFAKQTNVNISNSVNNMSAILEKISTTQLDASKAIPKQLQQLINNVVQNAFSLEETLGQGVGSALSSERYSVEQLANLNKMFTQLANSSPESLENLGQELQTILETLKGNLSSETNLQPVLLNKAAFQLLNDGGSRENLSPKLVQLLEAMSSSSNSANGDMQAVKQLLDVLFPQLAKQGSAQSNIANMNAARAYANANTQGSGQTVVVNNGPNGSANTGNAAEVVLQNNGQAGANGGSTVNANGIANSAGNANAGVPGGAADNGQQLNTQQNNVNNTNTNTNTNTANGNTANNANNGQAANANASGANANGQKANANMANANGANSGANNIGGPGNNAVNSGNSASNANNANTANTGNNVQNNNQGNGQVNQNGQASTQANVSQASSKAMQQAAELENNPLFKQIFSRYGYTQETGITKQAPQPQQAQLPPINSQQAMASFKSLAQLLVKDGTLTAKDTALLNNFVNGSQTQLSEGDAKQLTMLLRLVQSNIPPAVQQAGQQMGMDGLPKLWAFAQLSELAALKDIKNRDYENATKQLKTMISSLKGSLTSEGSYNANGEKAISFVMPLYLGENEISYPAYIHIYDEPPHEDERGVMRKDTWFRVCVLTENIGAVDIVCQLYEGKNLNLRVMFSDQEAVQAFSDYLPDIRKALYKTEINLTDLKVGTAV
ncbi:MAG: hypothetical protein PUF95_07500 [Selenomonadaceae bacterium]|nr:hypothetical protein [Selenomonadaceae bacterium]